MVTVKIKKTHPDAQAPQQMTEGSSGFDLCCVEDFFISGGRKTIDTGIAVEIPVGYEMQIRSRSGLAAKYGICVVNSPGTIDADYRGNIKVILGRIDKDLHQIDTVAFKKGDRIAQGVISVVPKVQFEVVDELSQTDRGSGGLGSTGL